MDSDKYMYPVVSFTEFIHPRTVTTIHLYVGRYLIGTHEIKKVTAIKRNTEC